MTQYIYQHPAWPNFQWNKTEIDLLLNEVLVSMGYLRGLVVGLGFKEQQQGQVAAIAQEITQSFSIEGLKLNPSEVRSSIAHKLGFPELVTVKRPSANIDGITQVALDGINHADAPLTQERLFSWYQWLFAGIQHDIDVGKYRADRYGPMQVVSGMMGNEKVHYQAPPSAQVPAMMHALLDFINQSPEHHILKAAVAHLWMVTIHPFDDGNGRLARAISELLLARVDASLKRFYSMSEAILRQRKAYYSSLENAQSGTMDISAWMRWFLLCLQDALNRAAETMQTVIRKYQLLHQFSGQLNERQKKMIDRLMTGFKGNLTSAKWAKINKVSQMTANRDIAELITLKILVSVDRGPHTHYVLTPTFASDAFSQN